LEQDLAEMHEVLPTLTGAVRELTIEQIAITAAQLDAIPAAREPKVRPRQDIAKVETPAEWKQRHKPPTLHLRHAKHTGSPTQASEWVAFARRELARSNDVPAKKQAVHDKLDQYERAMAAWLTAQSAHQRAYDLYKQAIQQPANTRNRRAPPPAKVEPPAKPVAPQPPPVAAAVKGASYAAALAKGLDLDPKASEPVPPAVELVQEQKAADPAPALNKEVPPVDDRVPSRRQPSADCAGKS